MDAATEFPHYEPETGRGKPWGPGSADEFRARLAPTWEPDRSERFAYAVEFDSDLAGFGEVLSAVGKMPISDVQLRRMRGDTRFRVAFTSTYETWQAALLAMRSCPVAGVTPLPPGVLEKGG